MFGLEQIIDFIDSPSLAHAAQTDFHSLFLKENGFVGIIHDHVFIIN